MTIGARLLRWIVTASIFLFALLFLLLAVGSHVQLADARRLMEAGAQAEGIVTELAAARRSTAYRYSYRFAADGRSIDARDRSVPFGVQDALKPGARVAVRYDRANPARSTTPAELAELESWGNRLFFPLAGVALLAWAIARVVRKRVR